MDVVLADGTVLKLGRETRKGVTGYDLTALMIGSEVLGAIDLQIRLFNQRIEKGEPQRPPFPIQQQTES